MCAVKRRAEPVVAVEETVASDDYEDVSDFGSQDEQEEESFEQEGEEYEEGEEQEEEEEESEQPRVSKTFAEASVTSKKEKKEEQKTLAKTRKLAKPLGDLVSASKQTWERLRQKSVSAEEKTACMAELMTLMSGKIHDLVFKHDASRMVQTCLKYGNAEQRNAIALELKPHFYELSKSQYGNFIVSKILNFCTPDYRVIVLNSFHHHVVKAVRHRHACLVLEEVYAQFTNAAQKASLVQEFYGPEFSLFKGTEKKTLQEIITETPEKRQTILKNLYDCIVSILSKAGVSMGSVSLFHRVLLDFFTLNPDKGMVEEVVELLKDHLVSILHTREGARVSQLCLIHASVKTRKVILRSFKSFVKKIAIEQYGYSVLLTCFEAMDDTVLVGKAILSEIVAGVKPGDAVFSEGVESFRDLLMHKYGYMTVMFLLSGRQGVPMYIRAELASLDETRLANGKKDEAQRSNELIAIMSPFLLKVVEENLAVLLKDKFGSLVVVEVVNKCIGDKTALIDALVKLIGGMNEASPLIKEFNVVKKMKMEKEQKRLAQSNEHILVDRTSNKALKAIITTNPATIAVQVLEALKPNLAYWLKYCVDEPKSSGTAFALLAICECVESQQEFVKCVRDEIAAYDGLRMNEKSGVAILILKIKSLMTAI